MRYFSTFSGIGGFELGIGKKGECVGYSEIDKYAIQTYQKNFPEHKNYGDITRIIASELPDFDLLVGGFPCQAFSIAGKRAGFDDTRGTLFFDVARILKEKRPRLVVLENVKGLLSHDAGRTFKIIISTLAELGYAVEWQVLNAKNHGVPQNRERVFIIGHLGGFAGREVFPFRENGGAFTKKNGHQLSESAISGTLTATDAKMHLDGTYIKQVNNPTHSNDRVYDPSGLSPTLNTMQGGMRQPFIQNPKMMNYKKDFENSVAITATSYKEPPTVNAIRRLTPTECERLMGLPDNWTSGVSDTQRYKQCGNGVVVNVVQDIMEKLLIANPLL